MKNWIRYEDRIFEENLNEFVTFVSFTCSLEFGGKINPEEAYKRIKEKWKQLKKSKKELLSYE